MSDDQSEGADPTDEALSEAVSTEASESPTTISPIIDQYKILGHFVEAFGAAVMAQNDAGSGSPIGVYGATPNADGYGLCTPDNAMVEGLLEAATLDVISSAASGTTATIRNDAGSGTPVALEASTPNTVDGFAAKLLNAGVEEGLEALNGLDDEPSPPGDEAIRARNSATSAPTVTVKNEASSGLPVAIFASSPNSPNAVGARIEQLDITDPEVSKTLVEERRTGAASAFGTAASGSTVTVENMAGSGTPVAIEASTPNSNEGLGLSTPGDLRAEGVATVGGLVGYDDGLSIDGDATSGAAVTVKNEATSGSIASIELLNTNSSGTDTALAINTEDTFKDGSFKLVRYDDRSYQLMLSADAFKTTTGGTKKGDPSNLISGHELNEALSGVVGGVVGGGGFDDGTTSWPNKLFDNYGTIGGGAHNRVGDAVSGTESATYGTVGGGWKNRAQASGGTVGGGLQNIAKGYAGSVPGGRLNEADSYALAAGVNAKANDTSSFVWADGATDSNGAITAFKSNSGSGPTGRNTFHVRATGGARFVSGVDSNGNPSTGVELAAGGGGWNQLSARAAKRNVQPVDSGSFLEGVRDLDVSTWQYETQPGVRHVGPMAEAFHEAFGVGENADTINTLDADGVALAAIKGLAERLDEKDERIEAQSERITELEEKAERAEDLEERLEELEERLAALEA